MYPSLIRINFITPIGQGQKSTSFQEHHLGKCFLPSPFRQLVPSVSQSPVGYRHRCPMGTLIAGCSQFTSERINNFLILREKIGDTVSIMYDDDRKKVK